MSQQYSSNQPNYHTNQSNYANVLPAATTIQQVYYEQSQSRVPMSVSDHRSQFYRQAQQQHHQSTVQSGDAAFSHRVETTPLYHMPSSVINDEAFSSSNNDNCQVKSVKENFNRQSRCPTPKDQSRLCVSNAVRSHHVHQESSYIDRTYVLGSSQHEQQLHQPSMVRHYRAEFDRPVQGSYITTANHNDARGQHVVQQVIPQNDCDVNDEVDGFYEIMRVQDGQPMTNIIPNEMRRSIVSQESHHRTSNEQQLGTIHHHRPNLEQRNMESMNSSEYHSEIIPNHLNSNDYQQNNQAMSSIGLQDPHEPTFSRSYTYNTHNTYNTNQTNSYNQYCSNSTSSTTDLISPAVRSSMLSPQRQPSHQSNFIVTNNVNDTISTTYNDLDDPFIRTSNSDGASLNVPFVDGQYFEQSVGIQSEVELTTSQTDSMMQNIMPMSPDLPVNIDKSIQSDNVAKTTTSRHFPQEFASSSHMVGADNVTNMFSLGINSQCDQYQDSDSFMTSDQQFNMNNFSATRSQQTESMQTFTDTTKNQLTTTSKTTTTTAINSPKHSINDRSTTQQTKNDVQSSSPKNNHQEYLEIGTNGNLSQDWLDTICSHLNEHMNNFGICVIDNFLGSIKGEMIMKEVHQLYSNGQYSKGRLVSDKIGNDNDNYSRSNKAFEEQNNGGVRTSSRVNNCNQNVIGCSRETQSNRTIRNDRVIWVDGYEDGCVEINNLIQTLCSVITNSSRLSLYSNTGLDKVNINKRTKAHVACYPGSGTRYIKHVDNPNNDGRVITAIYYLNKNWNTKRDGGLLRMFPAGMNEVANIEPLFDRALFFWSDRRNPHEVLPSFRDRFAITVWYIGETRA